MIASAHLGRVPVPVRSAAATLVEALVSPEMLHGECVSIGCVVGSGAGRAHGTPGGTPGGAIAAVRPTGRSGSWAPGDHG